MLICFHRNSERIFFSEKYDCVVMQRIYMHKHTRTQRNNNKFFDVREMFFLLLFRFVLASERWAILLWRKDVDTHNVFTIMDHGSRKIIVREQDSWCGKTQLNWTELKNCRQRRLRWGCREFRKQKSKLQPHCHLFLKKIRLNFLFQYGPGICYHMIYVCVHSIILPLDGAYVKLVAILDVFVLFCS